MCTCIRRPVRVARLRTACGRIPFLFTRPEAGPRSSSGAPAALPDPFVARPFRAGAIDGAGHPVVFGFPFTLAFGEICRADIS